MSSGGEACLCGDGGSVKRRKEIPVRTDGGGKKRGLLRFAGGRRRPSSDNRAPHQKRPQQIPQQTTARRGESADNSGRNRAILGPKTRLGHQPEVLADPAEVEGAEVRAVEADGPLGRVCLCADTETPGQR